MGGKASKHHFEDFKLRLAGTMPCRPARANVDESADLEAVHAVAARLKDKLIDVRAMQQIGDAAADCGLDRRNKVCSSVELRRLHVKTPLVFREGV